MRKIHVLNRLLMLVLVGIFMAGGILFGHCTGVWAAEAESTTESGVAGSVRILSLDQDGNPQEGVEYILYGILDNGTEGVEISDMEGMTLYEWGRKKTDADGTVKFQNLSTNSKEWYMVKNISSGDFFHIKSLPYILDYEASDDYDGYFEKEDGNYLYYDLTFTNQNQKLLLSIPEKESSENEKKEEEDSSWIPLYSTVEPRENGGVLTRIMRSKVNASGKVEAHSIYMTSGDIYMACCQHEKRYPVYGSKGEGFKEYFYTGQNKAKLRKALYYGYGGYDQGKSYLSSYDTSTGNYFIATVLLFSYYNGHKNPFSDWKVFKNLKAFVEAQPDPVEDNRAATAISFSKESDILHDGKLENLAAISESQYKDWEWSDNITVSSDGEKNMNITIPKGIAVYIKSEKNILEATDSARTFSVKGGEVLKFAHKKSEEASEYKVKMTSEGGITAYEPVYADTDNEKHQDLIRAYYQETESLTASLLLSQSAEEPKMDEVLEKGSLKQTIKVYKKDEEGNPLAGATFSVTCQNGESKTVVSDENGLASVDFELELTSDHFRYLLNAEKLTKAQLEDYLKDDANKRTKEEALASAKENLEEKKAKEELSYEIKEISAPEGYLAEVGPKKVSVTGQDENQEIPVFINEAFPGVSYISKTVYFYQEIKATKENALFGTENNTAGDAEFLEGAEFTVKNESINGAARLVEIFYNKGDEIIELKNERGADESLDHPHDSFIMTTAKNTGLARAGFVYAVTSSGSYGYPQKEWASYSSRQQEIMEEAGIYHSSELAVEAANANVMETIRNISCTYTLQETKAPMSLNGNPFNISFPDELKKTIAGAEGSMIELSEARAKYMGRK